MDVEKLDINKQIVLPPRIERVLKIFLVAQVVVLQEELLICSPI